MSAQRGTLISVPERGGRVRAHYPRGHECGGGVIIILDAPPMNELVTPEAGLLAGVDRSASMGIGKRYFVNHDDLERKIRHALSMSQSEREAFGRAARARFEAIDQAFRVRIKECVNGIFDGPSSEPADTSIALSP